ncbi:MAG: PqqD family protein [Rhizobacter sp.]|nr:PqqD family protein [Burkholderiales bacterium]
MDLLGKLALPPQVMARQLGDEQVFLDLASGAYFGLDPVGSKAWNLLAEGKTISDVCDLMIEEYDVTRAALEADIVTLVQSMIDRQLVSVIK